MYTFVTIRSEMGNITKIDMKLTKGNKGSLTLSLNAGTENSLVMGEVLSNGLSTIPSSTAGSTPLKKGLNFTSFLGVTL